MNAVRHTFSKEERLCSNKIIERLLDRQQNSSVFIFPILFAWIETPLPGRFPTQVLISVPRRRFRKAHDRNLLKRRLREAYRLHKHQLYDFLRNRQMQVALLVMYNSNELHDYSFIEEKLISAFEKFQHKV
ncbi:MAG: ribonuclease P protein component [Bacteroidia bacterium]